MTETNLNDFFNLEWQSFNTLKNSFYGSNINKALHYHDNLRKDGAAVGANVGRSA